jgi:hypothetical protein
MTYTFHLRQGVKFHDGTDFNAQVVDFNVRRIWDKDFEHYYPRANSFTFYAFEPLEEITVDDDYTVTMQLKRPFAEFLRMQNQSYGEPLMISPEAVRTHGNEGFALGRCQSQSPSARLPGSCCRKPLPEEDCRWTPRSIGICVPPWPPCPTRAAGAVGAIAGRCC